VKPAIEKELGCPLETVFAEVCAEPLAAASLAQVYAARLHDGSEVVIKVQRPDIERTIEVDLAILHDLARLFQARTPLGRIYDLPAMAEDFAHTMSIELDYRYEGRYADQFRENFKREKYLHVPEVFWKVSTRRVLVLERIEGIKIDQVEALVAAGYDPRDIAHKCAHFIIKEIFGDGFFHADPHPGNLVVMPGEVIGVIDFGMVGWLSQRDKMSLLRLYLGILQSDAEAIIEALVRLGAAQGEYNRDGLLRDINRLLQKYTGMALGDIRASVIINEFMTVAFRHRLSLPPNLWLLSKTLVIMEGVGLKLDPEFDTFAFSRPYIRRLKWQFLSTDNWLPPVTKGLEDWSTLFLKSPGLGLEVLQQLSEGDLKVNLEISNVDRVMIKADKIASRLAVSIVLAALIMALAYLIPNVANNTITQFLVGGAFVIVSGLGLRLLYSIFRSGV
ncbi:MAG: phosphotransferase, partial [Anaerolineae bacterium]|nr:phosphotransferase [Anaerolineae bacterium]